MQPFFMFAGTIFSQMAEWDEEDDPLQLLQLAIRTASAHA